MAEVQTYRVLLCPACRACAQMAAPGLDELCLAGCAAVWEIPDLRQWVDQNLPSTVVFF